MVQRQPEVYWHGVDQEVCRHPEVGHAHIIVHPSAFVAFGDVRKHLRDGPTTSGRTHAHASHSHAHMYGVSAQQQRSSSNRVGFFGFWRRTLDKSNGGFRRKRYMLQFLIALSLSISLSISLSLAPSPPRSLAPSLSHTLSLSLKIFSILIKKNQRKEGKKERREHARG